MDDPYLPPATELREEQAPRHVGRVLVGCLLAYATAAAVSLALEPSNTLNLRSQADCVVTGLGVGALLLQFRQLSWGLVALVAPPSAIVLVFALGVAGGFFGV